MREYTGGVSLVNASETTTFSATLPPGSYKDLYNGGVGSPVTLPPTTGLVLLKTSGSACSNSPPVTSAVSVTNITAFTATVNWVTNRPTDGQVEFIGVCPSTGCLTSLVSTLDTTHAINVSGLSPNTAYTYRIRSKDAAGNLVVTNNLTFTTVSNDTIPPVLSSISAINVTSTDATFNWTTNELADGQIEFVSPCPAIGCLTPLVSGLTTSHAITVGNLSANTSYTYRIRSKDAAGNLTVTTNQTFTTAVTGGAIGLYSLWNNAVTPANTTELDSRAIELGVKFKSDIAGAIYGIRFYKGPQNTGVHNVSLWTASGTLLARSASTTETATGWQQVSFSSPVNISANTTYVASYHTTSGFYSANDLYFGREYNNAPLHALADEASGGNGLWQTASAPTFPTQAYRSDNFWVDVVFSPTVTPPPVTQPPVTPPPPTGGTYTLFNNTATPATVTELDSRAIELGTKFTSDIAGAIYGIRFYKGPQNTGIHNVSLWTTSGTLLARSQSTSETASGWQQVNFASPVNIAASTTYVASYHTTSGFYSVNESYFTSQYDKAPLHVLANAASGGNGIYKTSDTPTFPNQTYRADNFWVDVVLGPAVTAAGKTYTLWSNSTVPAKVTEFDPRAIELGVKFKSDVDGAISGIRFYKGPSNTGTHTVSLWTTTGALLARSVSVSESASGWQQVNFASPVTISANTTYIASTTRQRDCTPSTSRTSRRSTTTRRCTLWRTQLRVEMDCGKRPLRRLFRRRTTTPRISGSMSFS